MSRSREAFVLPLLFLTVALLGGVRVADRVVLLPPPLFALVLAFLLVGVLMRSGALAPEHLMSATRSPLANVSGAFVIVTAFVAATQAFNVAIPESGLPRLLFSVFLLVLLMITREGMEMAFITATLARQEESVHMLWGALIGIALAGLLAWGWSRFGHRVNLGLFFQVTSIFLVLFALQLLVYAFHEATEANVLPIDNSYWHIATEPYGPEGKYGAMLTYALVLLPALWIAWSAFGRRRNVGPAGSVKS